MKNIGWTLKNKTKNLGGCLILFLIGLVDFDALDSLFFVLTEVY